MGILPLLLAATAAYVDVFGIAWLAGWYRDAGGPDAVQASATPLATWVFLMVAYLTIFVLGVVLGSIVGRGLRASFRRRGILAVAAILLALAAWLGVDHQTATMAVLITLATGALNAVFATDEEQRFGFLFLATILGRLGRNLAEMDNGIFFAWVPDLLRLVAVIAAAVAGLVLFRLLGAGGLFIAALVVALMAALYHDADSDPA